jgi:hypothetical protein
MLPVVVGERATAIQIAIYSFVVVGASLLLQPAAGMGTFYVVSAVILGAGFVAASMRLLRQPAEAINVFRLSNVYLALVFAAVAIDVLVAEPAAASQVIAWIGGSLVVIGSLAIVAVTRPSTLREFGFVLDPAVGAVTASLVVLSRS